MSAAPVVALPQIPLAEYESEFSCTVLNFTTFSSLLGPEMKDITGISLGILLSYRADGKKDISDNKDGAAL